VLKVDALFMGEKTTKPLERRQMKFDNRRSSTISSERGIIQISTLALTTSIATATFVMVFFTYAPILTAAGQAVSSLGKAPNNNTSSSAAVVGATATTSNTFPTLGNPS
jgi:hypothetical protein